jgi:hypothetical protein
LRLSGAGPAVPEIMLTGHMDYPLDQNYETVGAAGLFFRACGGRLTLELAGNPGHRSPVEDRVALAA